jgi:hypothetical protein
VRAARHQASLQQRQTEYKEGLNCLNRPTFPSAEELQRSSFKQQSSSDNDKRATLHYHFQLAKEIATARQTQQAISKEALQQIKAGGVGHVPEDKGDETARFIFENFNFNAQRGELQKARGVCNVRNS